MSLGALASIGPAVGFPLAHLRLPATIAHRLVLVGDAAHGVHPLAGKASTWDSAMSRPW
jgi:2-polyprenyl-6-methoxyphenol hydroxylase-like FAD-dependent oxidoreductase